MACVNFEPKTHIYSYKGRRVPSVTQTLEAAGLINTDFFNDEAALRGTYVHKAIEFYHNGGLNLTSLDGVIRPYVEAYFDFEKTMKFRPLYTEKLVFDPVYKYAGRLDLVGPLSGKMSVIDIKTGVPQPWTAAQLAAYRAALHKTVEIAPITGRYALQLKPSGKWSLKPYNDPRAFDVFLAALTIYNFKNGRI